MAIKTKLVMNFKTVADKTVSLSVDDPRTNLTEQEVKDAMALIVSKNVFAPNGSNLAATLDAKVISTDTTDYDLVIE